MGRSCPCWWCGADGRGRGELARADVSGPRRAGVTPADRIEFEGHPHRPDDGSSGIRIRINGRDLRELVREVEAPFAAAEGAPFIAGAYAGLPPDAHVLPPARHFMGTPAWNVYAYGTKTQVLQCDCGEPGCWPLVCRIDVSKERVTWTDFEQPFRISRDDGVAWTYEALGPFSFDRDEYERALAKLAPALLG